jgi:hypothetical protein
MRRPARGGQRVDPALVRRSGGCAEGCCGKRDTPASGVVVNFGTDHLTPEKLAALADSGTDYGRDPVKAAFLLGRLSITFDITDELCREAVPVLVARVQARMNAWHAS